MKDKNKVGGASGTAGRTTAKAARASAAKPAGATATKPAGAAVPTTAAYPKRLKRSESFLGVHFDFHATIDDPEIGEGVDAAMVQRIIEAVKPDYLQCDCKGHPGISSYPTKAGNPAPGIKKDTLRIWREATAAAGVSLYMHYSGVWDTEAIKRHPAWARIDEKGKKDPNNTSVFGPYVDGLLLPQLKELRDGYGVDGVWVDGECWATCQDYCRKAIAAFTQKTGIAEIPKKPEDPYFFEYTEFCRDAFRAYLKYYVDEMHRHDPGFEIASNWAYTSFMPEPVGIDLDFISGDYTPQDSVNSARFEGRCMTRQGKPWDLMAWAFVFNWAEKQPVTKSAVQLKQEAAQVLALGGGFQAYFQQKRDGSVALWQMEIMKEVAEFCRRRQAFCHRAKAVPQVGLLYSAEAFYRGNRRLFGHWDNNTVPMEGTLHALLDNQYSVEILMEHHLGPDLGDYGLVVVPEWSCLGRGVKAKLLSYARDGGSLLVVGAEAVRLFEKELGVKLGSAALEKSHRWLSFGAALAGMDAKAAAAALKPGTEAIGGIHGANDLAGPSIPAATIAPFGKGRIAGIYFDAGERYANAKTALAREFIGAIAKRLFPCPIVKVQGSHCVDVAVNRIGGKLAVNLSNTSGPHADKRVYTFDEVPPVGPLRVTIKMARKPKTITLQPEGEPVAFEYKAGEAIVVLPALHIHSVLMVE